MGTSLSGLTPATTFDGLLKVGDNDPLTATLKPISTGDGTDTMLELSTSALQIGGATGMYWDNTNKRLGIATDAPSVPFEVYGNVRFRNDLNLNGRIYNSASNKVNINNLVYIQSNVGIGESTPTSRLHVKGSGATSATTSLLVQNGEGSDVLRIYDNRKLRVDGQFELLYGSAFGIAKTTSSLTLSDYTINNRIYTNSNFKSVLYSDSASGGLVGVNNTAPTAQLHIKGSGNDNTTTSLLVQNSDGGDLMEVTDNGILKISTAPSFNTLNIYSDGINDLKRIGTATGLAIGTTVFYPAASTQVHIKGSGATSATTALLVQNSAGTELMSVDDDGAVRANSIKGINYQNNHLSLGANAEFLNFVSIKAPKIGVNGTVPTDTQAYIKGSGNDATTTALLVQNSDGTELFKIQDNYTTQITTDGGSSPALYLNTGSGREGGDGGLSIGSDTTKFNINSRFGNGVINASSSLFLTSSVGIGGNYTAASSGTARLFVKGSGATSATTALLVENSAGTELLKVVDDGQLEIKSNSGRVSTTSGTSIFSYSSGGGGVLDVNPSNNNSVKFRARGDNDTFLIQTNPAGDNVGIGASSPDSTAKLQVDSTTQGFLPPRMTDAERDAITTPAAGLMVYNTTTNKAQCYNGTAWQDLF